MRLNSLLLLACAAALLTACPPLRADDAPPPFTIGIELPSQVPMTPAEERALKELGIGYVNYYVNTFDKAPDRPPRETNAALMALCARLGLDFSLSCHVLDPPDEVVRDAAATRDQKERKGRFRGVVFDELEHIRLLNLLYGQPLLLADPKGFRSLPQAYAETVQGFEKLRKKFEALGSPVVATHVFPVLLHAAARAGFGVCPKICKEFYSPVSYAIGMGAALQYGVPLWADCDMWYYALVPGHTPEEVRSNLLLAYWLGADLAYLEGSGHNLTPAGNQGIPFSLMSVNTPELFQFTPHGEMLRRFCRDYLPAHPRSWTFRDVRPTVAIIRMDDTCWGQRYAGGFTQGLFGTDRLPCGPDSEAWFQIWNLLTCGATGRDGITFFKYTKSLSGYRWAERPGEIASLYTFPLQADSHRFFVPLTGTVVFDDRVGYERLKEIPLLFLTGPEVSGPTLEAIRRCVREGATCVAWGPLAQRHGFPDWKAGMKVQPEGKGKWVLTDDFGLHAVFQEVWPWIGHPDEIRYRFGKHEVVLRRVTENEVAVEVDGVRQ